MQLVQPHTLDDGAAGGPLLDRFGRVHTDLRVSLTDRCNLRCTYCMPEEGLAWLDKPSLLADDELVRLVGIAVRDLGIRTLRLTGGEPLLRRGLTGLVQAFAALEPRPAIAMTTNGVGLARMAGPLAQAGLDRVNVSLDTLSAPTYAQITRRDRLPDVLAGIEAAYEAGLRPVKVNAVPMRGVNEDHLVQLAERCIERDYQLRIIEQMPLDAQHGWDRVQMITADEVLERFSARWDLTPVPTRGHAPAQTYFVDGGPATIGIIASVTSPFCAACDRVRLTADGQLRNCLFATEESDLRAVLRSGAGDAQIERVWRDCIMAKKTGHGIDGPGFAQPERPMSAIGG